MASPDSEAPQLKRKTRPETPEGWAQYWEQELAASEKALRPWKDGSNTVIKEFLDDRKTDSSQGSESHLNLFWANISTLRAMLFGRTPEVDVVRRHADADDDEARISGPVILERILNTDIENGNDGYKFALKNALSDFLLTGFGNAWMRYEVKFERKPARKGPDGRDIPEAMVKDHETEDAVTDFVRWDDHLWSPTDIYENLRWAAKRVPMTNEMLAERFGQDVADSIEMDQNQQTNTGAGAEQRKDPWSRAEVWEIWDREHRMVFWHIRGQPQVLDMKKDILRLKNFWPFPRPMFANLTTSALVPKQDYAMVQDLYRDINNLQTRIALLESAIRVAGVYDQNFGDLTKLLNDRAFENILIPVDSMTALAEKGGLEAVIAFLPVQQIVEAIMTLSARLTEKKQMLYELTGMNDLTRGSTIETEGGEVETATAQRLKSKYSNVRIQAIQDEFARFATELQQIRAEIMVKNFDARTLLKRSNVLNTPDAQEAMMAIEMLKDEFPNYRVEVKSENIAMQDFTQLKMERSEFLQALSTLMRDALPMAQMFPQAIPVLLETIKWALAGFRGSGQIEGVFDKAIKQAAQAAEMAQQMAAMGQGGNPEDAAKAAEAQAKTEQVQMKAEADMKKLQMKYALDEQKNQADIETERERQQIQTQANVAETYATEQIKAQFKERELAGKIREAQVKEAQSAREREAKLQDDATRAAMRPQTPPKGGRRG